MISGKEKTEVFSLPLWRAYYYYYYYYILVYISIILDVSRDYRNWLIPIIAFFVVLIIAIMGVLIFHFTTFNDYFNTILIDYDLKYIKTIFQNLAMVIYIITALFAFFAMLYILPKKLSNFHHSYQKIIFCSNKNRSVLIYSNNSTVSNKLF